MGSAGRRQRWLGLVADATGATLYAVDGKPPNASLAAVSHVQYDPAALSGRAALPELARFVAEHELAGCPAHLHFAGAGTVVHKLHMPPMRSRQRAEAIRTRLTTYAAGPELCIDQRLDARAPDEDSVQVLAVGVDKSLVRGLGSALRRVGLRVAATTVLTAACGSPTDRGRAVQLVMGERTTAIQLFDDGRLVFCRDILLGRADFVAAYQRPIISEKGPFTLTREQADQLTREVGIPLGREETPFKSVRPDQLWPLITPALQRLRNEIQQTRAEHWGPRESAAALSALCLPGLPGLGDYLAAQLGLETALIPDDRVEAEFLAALHGNARRAALLDLSPPEERFVKHLTRPALAAGLVALLIMFSNAYAPREAHADIGSLRPATATLGLRLDEVRAQLSVAREERDQLLAALTEKARLAQVLPADTPLVAISRALFATLPENVELLEAHLDVDAVPAGAELSAVYRGGTAAGAVAADWARRLAEQTFCESAEVASVSGNGRDEDATIALRVILR